MQVRHTRDDAFEWFGGHVSATHLVAVEADDDAFDLDQGVTGTLQWLYVQHDEAHGNNGFEVSNQGGSYDAEPRTDVTVANATIAGGGPAGDRSPGVTIKEGARFELWNSLIYRPTLAGVAVLNEETFVELESGEVLLRGNRIISPDVPRSTVDCDPF